MTSGPRSPDSAPAALHPTVLDDEMPQVTRNYAEALVDVAAQEGQVEAVLDELDEFVADLLGDPFYREALTSPTVPTADRDRALAKALEGRALPTVVRFLRVLNQHGRLGLLGPIVRKARATWDRRQNRVPVEVRSAVALDDGQQASLRDRLGRMLAATAVVSFRVDPSLIGGLVVQVGDDVYDASVRTQLAQMRRRMVEGKIGELRARRAAFTE
jgi:F-type H+-transporting ATPase subunit delta